MSNSFKIFFVLTLLFSPFFLDGIFVKSVKAQAIISPAAVPGEVIIKLKNSDKLYLLKNKTQSEAQFILNNWHLNERIEYAEPNYLVKASLIPNDPDFLQQYYFRQVNAPLAWEISTGLAQIVVAVLDSGIDYDNPDLKHNIWVNAHDRPNDLVDNDANGKIDDFYGWNFVDNNNNIKPVFANFTELGINHGTVVSGIIAARGNNNLGIAGAAWQTKVMNLKVLDNNGIGDSARVIEAIDYAIAQQADVLNLSLVGTNYSQSLQQALQRAWDAGMVIAAAAGNEVGAGVDMDVLPAYPVCHDGNNNIIIGVVAVDKNNQLAEFSNYGSRCSDVSAPGVNFYSTVAYNENFPGFNHHWRGGYSGTSVATPVVSGLAALIKGINPSLTNEQIRNIILNTTTNIDNSNPDYAGKLGTGLVNYGLAAAAAKATKTETHNPVGQDWLVTAAGPGGGPHIRVFDYQGNVLSQWFAYNENFRGGMAVSSGDVDGDGLSEIVTAAGPGGGPHIRVFDTQGNVKSQFFAYESEFRGGVSLAVGDIDSDGQAEIITVPQSTKESVVKIFDNTGHLRFKFLAYADNFYGGASVALGDIDGDGQAEIITGAGPGGGPHIRVFSRQGLIKSQFFSYDMEFRGGVKVALGDIDGDGQAEIITGAGPGGGPHVRVFSHNGKIKRQFFAFDPESRAGVNVAIGDLTGDSQLDILTSRHAGAGPEVRIFKNSGVLLKSLTVYGQNFFGGVNLNVLQR